MSIYLGPKPKSINPNWPDHQYDKITCLIDGSQHKSLAKYLTMLGSSKSLYLKKFPDAPIISQKTRENYQRAANKPEAKKKRSETITKLNHSDSQFQEKRIKGFKKFLDSEKGSEYKKLASERTKKQHRETDLDDKIRNYFKTTFVGSKDQKRRSNFMKENNPSFNDTSVKKRIKTQIKNNSLHNNGYPIHKFRDSKLFYQSSYELDFLEYCVDKLGIDIKNIKNGKHFITENDHYVSDFILFDKYNVEIKSSYIEQIQLDKNPTLLIERHKTVEEKGYIWLYIKDKNYSELDLLFN